MSGFAAKRVQVVGDSGFIPVHSDIYNNSYDGHPNAGDMYYGQIGGGAMEIPVFSIGRLPVDTHGQAEVIIDKIIAYETDPTVEVKSYPPVYLDASIDTWKTRSKLVLNVSLPDPSDIGSLKMPVFAVAVEPVTGAVVGRAILLNESIGGSNTVSIPIDEQKLGNYNKVNVYVTGSEVVRSSVPAEF